MLRKARGNGTFLTFQQSSKVCSCLTVITMLMTSQFLLYSVFYSQLLTRWSEFREEFASPKDWHNIIWNNRDIRIEGSPVFYKNFSLSGVAYLRDLLLNCNNISSFEIAARNIEKSNFLIWMGLRDSIPSHLKDNTISKSPSSTIQVLSLSTGNGDKDFCANTKKSRDYYSLYL